MKTKISNFFVLVVSVFLFRKQKHLFFENFKSENKQITTNTRKSANKHPESHFYRET